LIFDHIDSGAWMLIGLPRLAFYTFQALRIELAYVQVGAGDTMDKHIQMLEVIAQRRMRLSLLLTAALFSVLAVFFYLIAFHQTFMGTRLVPGLSMGLVFALVLFPIIWAIVATYVKWANTHYDHAVEQIRITINQGGTRR